MGLSISSTVALRSYSQLNGLVEAIVGAPTTEPETDSIEWKGLYDLSGQASHRFGASRHILGFGNRHPDRAAAEFDGCSYLVLGAEPQAAVGVTPEDPAKLDDWLSPYIGSDGPAWSVDYVEVRGAKIAVITIEAPRWGDSIGTLQKGYDNVSAGRIFVRRGGKTVEADPTEVRMLEARAKRAASRVALDLVVKDPGHELRTFVAEDQERVNWINSEAIRLARTEPRQRRRGLYDYPASPLATLMEDTRGREEYEQEIADYLSKAGPRWYALVMEGAIAQGLAPLEFVVKNATEANFAGVQVELELPDGVYPFLSRKGPHRLFDAPEAPDLWGTRKLGHIVSPLDFDRAELHLDNEIEQREKSFHVTFDAVHLRPHAKHPLPPLHLAIPRDWISDDEIRIGWTATSTSAAGSVGGEIVLPVARDPVGAVQLVGAVT